MDAKLVGSCQEGQVLSDGLARLLCPLPQETVLIPDEFSTFVSSLLFYGGSTEN